MSDLAAAKAQLAFAELTGGVKFSGRKHGRDMAVFSRKKSSQQNGVGGGGGTAGSRAGDPPATRGHAGASASGRAHDAPAGTGSKKSKKGKASTGRDAADWKDLGGGDDDADGEGDIDVFGGSASRASGGADASDKKEKKRRKSALQEAADEAAADRSPRSAQEEAANILRKTH